MSVKPKYSIGQFVETESESGKIIGILFQEEHLSYQVDLKPGNIRFVEEDEIKMAYDPVKAPKKRVRRKKEVVPSEQK